MKRNTNFAEKVKKIGEETFDRKLFTNHRKGLH